MQHQIVRVCCGPRCGQEPRHRQIFDTAEAVAAPGTVQPTLCRGHCGNGVTVVLPGGGIAKVREPGDVAAFLRGPRSANHS